MKTLLLSTLALLLFGCATVQPPVDYQAQLAAKLEQRIAAREAVMAQAPYCDNERICDAMWAEARKWLSSRSRYRFQIMTDNFMQTYSGNAAGIYGSITRRPVGDGWRIEADLYCGFVCVVAENDIAVMTQFNAAIAAVTL